MNSLSNYELEQRYEDMLDECCGMVAIAGLEYSTGSALKAIDPVAYRGGFNDWLDAEISEGNLFELDGEYYDEEPTEEEESA